MTIKEYFSKAMQTPPLSLVIFFQVVACVSVSWLQWMQLKGHKVKEITVRLRIVAGQSCFRVLEKIFKQYVKSSGRYFGAFVVTAKKCLRLS